MAFELSVIVSDLTEDGTELESTDNSTAVIEISPGDRAIYISEATSPVMDGSVVYANTVERQTASLVVRAYGADPETIIGILEDLEKLFSQLSYTITVTIGEHIAVWNCSAATTSRGNSGKYESDLLSGGYQDLVINIPRQPDLYV